MATLARTSNDSVMAEPGAIGPRKLRLESVDVPRGMVMILMALDHTRDFFGINTVSPTDLAQTTIPLFFTRWITHQCSFYLPALLLTCP
jgi:uncharacterized membrane protein